MSHNDRHHNQWECVACLQDSVRALNEERVELSAQSNGDRLLLNEYRKHIQELEDKLVGTASPSAFIFRAGGIVAAILDGDTVPVPSTDLLYVFSRLGEKSIKVQSIGQSDFFLVSLE